MLGRIEVVGDGVRWVDWLPVSEGEDEEREALTSYSSVASFPAYLLPSVSYSLMRLLIIARTG